MKSMTLKSNPGGLASLKSVAERAQTYAEQSRAENTKKAYRSDWRHFSAWCYDNGLDALPASPETVTLYITRFAEDYKVSTLERRLAAISQAHKTAGYNSPALTSHEPLHSVWAGILRAKTRIKKKVAPTLTEDIRAMLKHLPQDTEQPGHPLTLTALRDRAILLIGFAGAMRRSEVADLHVDDLQFTPDGLRVRIRKSKTDQEGTGQVIGVLHGENPDTCPIRAARAWMHAAGIHNGPIFRAIDRHGNIAAKAITGRSVATIIKNACLRCGLPPDLYSGHSLRAGFTTQAARAGKAERVIMKHTRHKSEKMVREYIREGELFNESPTDALGL